jgi:hypothetical protein
VSFCQSGSLTAKKVATWFTTGRSITLGLLVQIRAVLKLGGMLLSAIMVLLKLTA